MCNFFFFYVFNSQKMCNFALAKSKIVHLPLGRYALFASCEEALVKSKTVHLPLGRHALFASCEEALANR